jgi:hypothetical protein
MSTQLKGDHRTEDRRLDRLPPSDWRHYEKFPLTASIRAITPIVPVVLGVNWYQDFMNPQKDSQGRYWIGKDPKNLGPMLGGHAICVRPYGWTDSMSWYKYYDQGEEGRCAQFAVSRAMSLLNRMRYEIRQDREWGHWLYWRAQSTDEWPGGSYPKAEPFYEGTSVRAVLEILRTQGLIRYNESAPRLDDGIQAYRWLRFAIDVAKVTGYAEKDYVALLNSWGTYYPHYVYMPLETLDRLIQEDGEAAAPTDK